MEESAGGKAVLAACTGLKAKAATPGNPDPSKFVPIETIEGMRGEIAALTARLGDRDQKDLDSDIEAALEDGRLHKSMKEWAQDLGKSNRAALSAYLDQAKPIAALIGSQTGGEPPVPDEKTGLTKDELAACSAMGVTPEQFKAAKEA
ncbi:Mu-like prophage I protein [compost metagenome]